MSATFSPLSLTTRVPAFTQQKAQELAKNSFTWANLAKNIALITALIAINKAGMPGNIVFYCILCFWACFSTQSALKALSVGLLALVANTYFVDKTTAFSIGRFAILGVCACRVFFDLRNSGGFQLYRKSAIALGVFIGLAAVMSFITNYFLLVSLLKLINFSLGIFIIMGSVEVVRKSAGEITCWMVSICSVVVVLGLVASVVGQGYNAKDIGGLPSAFFNGPFYHSNTLGPLAAMMVVYLAAIAIFTPYKLRFLAWPLLAALIYFMLLTQSRTAMASCLGGLGVLAFVAYRFSLRKGPRIRFNLSLGTVVGVGLLALLMIIIVVGRDPTKAVTRITDFIVKRESTYGLNVRDILHSREGQIEMMRFNIERLPLTGIGFGTSIDPYFAETAKWFSAPTEKGNIVLAVAEESGIPAALVFWFFIFTFYRNFWSALNASAIAVFTSFLLVNMGEMMFFSFGGHGAFGWLIVGAAMALGDRCIVQAPPPPPPALDRLNVGMSKTHPTVSFAAASARNRR